MMRALFLFLVVLKFGCGATDAAKTSRTAVSNDSLPTHPPDSVAVYYGTFSGECYGYCTSEYRFHSWGIEKFDSSWEAIKYPPQYFVYPFSKTVYDSLISSVDIKAISALPERIGSPDCNDGGGEWIEVQCGVFKKRITFPSHTDIPEIKPLLHFLRGK